MLTIRRQKLFIAAITSAALALISTGCGSTPVPIKSASAQSGTSGTSTSTTNGSGVTTSTTTVGAAVTVAKPWNSARIASGDYHTCIIDSANGVWCWGGGGAGQLGNGKSVDSASIVRVSNLTSGVQAIAAGGNHTCALTTAGAVYCWGSNAYGQIGDGTTTYRNVPTLVSGLSSGVVALAAGNVHTCAITSLGAMACWGDNTYGQLGIGSTAGATKPTQVSFFAGATSYSSATGLVASRSLASVTISKSISASLLLNSNLVFIGSGRRAVALSLGYHHSCATDSAGALYCWGYNADGRLGDGSTTQRNSPVAVSGLTSGVQSIATGYYHSCAIDALDSVWCWGSNDLGELGQGGGSGSTTPLQVTSLAMSVQNLVAGARHTCATDGVNTISCWGDNSYGQLGTGSATSDELSPVQTSSIVGSVRGLAMAGYHSCALDGSGVQCWGNDYYGQLGDGNTMSFQYTPVNVTGVTPAQ